MIHWESEARKKRNNNTALPRSTVVMRLDDTVHDSITNSVLDLRLIDHGPIKFLVSH